jgi:hypothetical protein
MYKGCSIQVGDLKRFIHFIQHALKKERLFKVGGPSNGMPSLFGMPITENKFIPKKRAVLLNKKGEVLSIIDL